MPEYQLSRAEVDDLGDKLASLETDLTETQRAFLAGLLRLSGHAVGAATDETLVRRFQLTDEDVLLTVRSEGALPSLKEQFSRAFTPGRVAGGAAALPQEGVTTSVGVGVRF